MPLLRFSYFHFFKTSWKSCWSWFLARNWLVRIGLVCAALILLLVTFTTLTPQGRATFHTALFVAQILDLPWKPQSWLTPTPVRQEVTFARKEGTGVADIYLIDDAKSRAAVLVFLGANAAGRDDEDVINLGNALAKAGFVAMFYWSPTMGRQANIDSAELDNLVAAFQYLQAQSFVDPDRVGMGGFCVGASFVLVAASDPQINEHVHFVNAFGPYYDAHDLLLQIASRSAVYQNGHLDRSVPWEPDQLTIKVFANELIEATENPSDQELLRARFLEQTSQSQSMPAGLTKGGQDVFRLLTGTSREEAEGIYQRLPAQFRRDMELISPSSHIENLKAKTLIMHDRDDRLIPAAQSRRLFAVLQERGDVRYTEVLAFEHVRPAGDGSLWLLIKEGYKLFRHTYGIIRLAQ